MPCVVLSLLASVVTSPGVDPPPDGGYPNKWYAHGHAFVPQLRYFTTTISPLSLPSVYKAYRCPAGSQIINMAHAIRRSLVKRSIPQSKTRAVGNAENLTNQLKKTVRVNNHELPVLIRNGARRRVLQKRCGWPRRSEVQGRVDQTKLSEQTAPLPIVTGERP